MCSSAELVPEPSKEPDDAINNAKTEVRGCDGISHFFSSIPSNDPRT
jgi:hypothetical protein